MAYVTTGYPHVSHTFIQREVRGLRAAGADIATFTVRRAEDAHIRSADDRAEATTTYALRPVRVLDLVKAHARAVVSRPGLWWDALRTAVRTGGSQPRDALWHLFYFVQAVLLWDQVRRTGARHVHAHFANVSSDLAWLASLVGGPGWSWSFTMHGPTEFADQRAHRLAEKTAAASFVVAISDFARSQLMALVTEDHWDKLEVVHCAIDTTRFAPSPSTSVDRELAILCVARMVPVKGHAVLLRAMHELAARDIGVTATLIGDGPGRAGLEALAAELGIADRVTFAGVIGQDEIRAFFDGAEVFTLPSFAEGVPVVLMEAMAMQVPVIASRVAGIAELVTDGVSGRLLPPGREDLLADALEAFAAAPDLRIAMGKAGRQKISDEFELRACTLKLLDIYRHRIGSSPAT